ncbi:MAG: hypothetical protein ABF289_07640 [Clostridiales bacterium]
MKKIDVLSTVIMITSIILTVILKFFIGILPAVVVSICYIVVAFLIVLAIEKKFDKNNK